MDAAAELIANEPEPRDRVALSKLATARLGKDVIDVENLCYSIDGRELLHDVTWRLGPGDRVGLVGVNGAGKTTLLRLIQGELSPTKGRVKLGKTVKIAILSQDVRELDEFHGERIFQLLAREKTSFNVDKKEVSVSQLVEQLGFSQAQLQTPIEDLSGGQRRKLQFLRLLFGGPNVLILDEPTSDLDTDILAAMEDLLDGWPGTLIVVSHDRYLLERVTDDQYALMGDLRLRHLTGGVDQYLALRAASLPFVVADANRERVDDLRQAGQAAVFGDAAEPETLVQAHIAHARLLVIATPDTLAARRMIETARALNPAIAVVARSHNPDEARRLAEGAGQGVTALAPQTELARSMAGAVLQALRDTS